MNWIKQRWAQISTKIGALIIALSPVVSSYAGVDPRFGYAGAFLGILAVLWNEKAGQ